ncbi:D-alanyl-D-alanine carboxypeptidase [Streptomyces sp. NBC_00347]|uniref:D-alanyl-D-alanine carboxypeptidase n=1 Tax=Streptomyces sp. NBC_00347 TaxID=2975721 RepID=UPI00225087D6|nr:D-alanyl-D-alanine carboxypeptidase [Streptomyces sp. NBC_00347]MCX5128394.1 D-alanyl-D-alanine carboxypeptidase [Streptomyces sp. NBC_00347]
MTAVPVEGETPGATKDEHPGRTPGPHDAQTPTPAQRTALGPEQEPAPRPDPRTVPAQRAAAGTAAAAASAAASATVAGSGAASESASGNGSEPESEPESATASESEPESAAVPEPGSVPVPRSGDDLEVAPDPASGPGVEPAAGGVAEPVPSARVVPDTVSASESPSAIAAQDAPEPSSDSVPESGGGQPVAGVVSTLGADPETASTSAAGPDDGPGSRPESDSERTSQFVALKSLDEAPSASAPVPSWARRPVPAPAPVRPAPAPAEPAPAAPAPGTGPGRTSGPVATPAAAPDRVTAPRTAPVGGGAPAVAPEGTTEQPLPALDLLAQLTNTPPPPETPARTVARRVRIWVPLLLLLVAVLAVVQALRPLPDAILTSEGAASSVALDGRFDVPWPEKGQAAVRIGGAGDVGTFGEQKPVPTASVAKVMTAYVILKNHPLKKDEGGPQIAVDDKAVADGKSASESRIPGLTTGTRFSQQDMLKMLMIPSGNNIARLLARWDTGSDSEAAFVEKMNAEAKALGMTSTTYTDPSGLDAKTVSTAVDQLKLAEEVMKFDAFRAIVQLPNATVPGLSEPLNNNNDDLLIAGLSIKGIKTGSSSAAGGTLVWAAYKTVGDKTPLILGTMLDQHVTGADPDGANSLKLVKQNSKKVIEAVRAALTSAGVVKKGQVVGYVDDGLGTRTPVVATRDTAAVAVPGQRLELTLAVGEKGLPAKAPAGTEIGVLTIGTGPGAPTVPVALQTDLSAPSLGTKLVRLR